MFSYFRRPKSLQDQLGDESSSPEQLSGAKPAAQSGWLWLGEVLKGERFPAELGVAINRGRLHLSEDVLDQHLLILGATGVGKSETIKRLVHEIFVSTKRDVYFVDGKGDGNLANDIRSLAAHHGRGEAPVFKLGFERFGAVYDAFRGHPRDIFNRLVALLGISDMEGDARYYAEINRNLLQLICYAPGGPPRNFEELRTRLDKRWLEEAYRHNPVELSTIRDLGKEDFASLANRVLTLAREFAPCVGNDGFALEETPCAIFSIRAQSVSDTARRFLDFLVEDLKDFVGKRQKRPGVLIIDEFGQFSNDNVIALLTLARSSKLGIILATQDTSNLKDRVTQRQVLANTRTKILMASDYPEDVGILAGTYVRPEPTFQYEDGQATGLGSVRMQHAFKIEMNEAAQLKPGEAFLIRQRHVAKVQVVAIDPVERISEQQEQKRNYLKTTASSRRRQPPPEL